VIDGYEGGYMYRSKDDDGVDNNALFGIRMVLVCNGCACFPATYQESER
jgi:hypothetical protein